MSRTRLAAVTTVVTAAVLVAVCGGSGSKASPKQPAASTTTTPKAPPVAPLTGLPTRTAPRRGARSCPSRSTTATRRRGRRPGSSPHIVWDEVVEGEATRFLAMFQSQVPDVVGPVRSVRLTDPLIVWPVGGVVAFSGGAKYPVDGINQAPVVRVDESAAGDAMFRD